MSGSRSALRWAASRWSTSHLTVRSAWLAPLSLPLLLRASSPSRCSNGGPTRDAGHDRSANPRIHLRITVCPIDHTPDYDAGEERTNCKRHAEAEKNTCRHQAHQDIRQTECAIEEQDRRRDQQGRRRSRAVSGSRKTVDPRNCRSQPEMGRQKPWADQWMADELVRIGEGLQPRHHHENAPGCVNSVEN